MSKATEWIGGLRTQLGQWIGGQHKRSAGNTTSIGFWLRDECDDCPGYTRLSNCPEIQTACLRIAELIGSMTIYLMENAADGDRRIVNELSRMIDISPCGTMTRTNWMTTIVMNLLLYGEGNSVVVPHTRNGLLEKLEPIPANRVGFHGVPGKRDEYRITIDGREWDPADLLHFVYNPSESRPWKGKGVTVLLKDVANSLKQAEKTKTAFMRSEYKPSIIVKVDALTEEFASPEGRQKLLEKYIHPSTPGEPWMIPAEAFDVTEVRPLSLNDLAIKDTMELDRRTVASVIGVPAFLLGVGAFNREEWNNFIQTKVRGIALIIQQELTRALILNPKWYLLLNFWSLMDYDMKAMSDILLAGSDRGFVNGDEWRDRMHMTPAGLKEYRVLENYIPWDLSGAQKKLVQNE